MTTDGNVSSVTQRYVSPAKVTDVTTGTQTGSTELRRFQYTGTEGYPYKASMEVNASRWLIYNRFDENATSNNFELEFNAGAGTKAGQDNLGGTDIGGDANTNRRIRW